MNSSEVVDEHGWGSPVAWPRVPIRSLTRTLFVDGDWIESPYITDSGVRLIQTGNIGIGHYKEQGLRYVSDETFDELRCTEVLPGDVLICRLADPVGRACVAPDLGVRMITSVDVTIVRPKPGVLAEYVALILSTERWLQRLSAMSQGGTRDRIARLKLGELRVPLPDLETQRRIVDLLAAETARIDTLIEKNERVLGLLERRRLSVVVAAVCGDRSGTSSSGHESAFWLGSMPREWVVAALGYRYDVQLGKMLSAERRESGDQRPYLANVDVQWDRFNVDGLRTMDLSDEEWPRYGVEPGDVLICEGGDIGRSAVWPIDGPSGIHFQKALHRARPLDPAEDNPRWLYYAMLAAAKTGVFQFGAEASTIDHLTGERLREHRFPFPPRDEQDRLVEDLDRAIAKIDSLRAKVDRQQELLRLRRQALITAAVTGQIEV